MKKILILMGALLAMYSCGNANKESKAENKVESKVEDMEAFKKEHNARNSLSYHGKYEGTIPAADGPGINVTIEIPDDSTYTRTLVYIGHEKDIFTDKGTYTWNEEGNTITLHDAKGEETPNQYFVSESRLIMLDTEGKQVEGEMAENYILKQTEGIEYDLSKYATKK